MPESGEQRAFSTVPNTPSSRLDRSTDLNGRPGNLMPFEFLNANPEKQIWKSSWEGPEKQTWRKPSPTNMPRGSSHILPHTYEAGDAYYFGDVYESSRIGQNGELTEKGSKVRAS